MGLSSVGVSVAALLVSILVNIYFIWENSNIDIPNIRTQILEQEKEGFDSLYKAVENQTNVLKNNIPELNKDITKEK